jgi:hypothetical protein
VFVITHMNHPIQRLRRFDHNNWILDDAPIGSQINAPTGVGGTVTNPQSSESDYLATTKSYVVTAINDAGQESQASAAWDALNDLSLKGDFNTVTWTAHATAVEYRIYEARSGVYGYLGSSKTTSFKDDNILADFSSGPPSSFDPFTDDQNPATITFHESRLWVGRTITRPNALFGSQTDDIFNFDRSSPLRATDSLALALTLACDGIGSDWLPRLDLAVQAFGHEPAVAAAVGLALAERQLWGKARALLEQAAASPGLAAAQRRRACRVLAAIARSEGDEARAQGHDRAAAALD